MNLDMLHYAGSIHVGNSKCTHHICGAILKGAVLKVYNREMYKYCTIAFIFGKAVSSVLD